MFVLETDGAGHPSFHSKLLTNPTQLSQSWGQVVRLCASTSQGQTD